MSIFKNLFGKKPVEPAAQGNGSGKTKPDYLEYTFDLSSMEVSSLRTVVTNMVNRLNLSYLDISIGSNPGFTFSVTDPSTGNQLVIIWCKPISDGKYSFVARKDIESPSANLLMIVLQKFIPETVQEYKKLH